MSGQQTRGPFAHSDYRQKGLQCFPSSHSRNPESAELMYFIPPPGPHESCPRGTAVAGSGLGERRRHPAAHGLDPTPPGEGPEAGAHIPVQHAKKCQQGCATSSDNLVSRTTPRRRTRMDEVSFTRAEKAPATSFSLAHNRTAPTAPSCPPIACYCPLEVLTGSFSSLGTLVLDVWILTPLFVLGKKN